MSQERDKPQGFLGAAKSSGSWGALAERLRRAADVVLREKRAAPVFENDLTPSVSFWLGAVHMMLLGQALEVAAKGLLVMQDPARVVDETRPRSPFLWRTWGHNLTRLVGETGIPFSPEEERVTRLLRDFVEWGGRYPAPMNLNTGHPLEWDDDDIRLAESLYDRLQETHLSIARSQAAEEEAGGGARQAQQA